MDLFVEHLKLLHCNLWVSGISALLRILLFKTFHSGYVTTGHYSHETINLWSHCPHEAERIPSKTQPLPDTAFFSSPARESNPKI